MKKNSLSLSLPKWVHDFLEKYEFPLVSPEERMRFVLDLTLQNIERATGGPFGAAVFERNSGKLVSVGLNVVLKQSCSVAHAEMMAIMLAQQELGTLLEPGEKNKELLHTLYVFLKNNQKLEKTMNDLSLSIGGMKYRIGKMKRCLKRTLKTQPQPPIFC